MFAFSDALCSQMPHAAEGKPAPEKASTGHHGGVTTKNPASFRKPGFSGRT
ncbi:hypothetical protein ATPR_1868 [Acetobacter tropicalis NBRC 101654]|uniref:Uncharacterized protein n=1 Tax=Acetobacter tropicalis NBRC 101654 TaxID=749388 RepID=F7VER9_9PROT|nr:hypothetical protein ATPR_1868 [Acetobacter tropicalis NBRC 101654]